MSNPSDAGGGVRFPERKQLAKRLEKSNFSQACNLLSQFLKEKRSLADLSSDMALRKKPRDELEKAKPPPPMVNTVISSDATRQPKDNLPKFVGFPSSGFSNNAINKGEFRRPATPEPATAQMTIFYAGKVLVYDDFPNERAKEIMAMADKGRRISSTAAVVPPAAASPNRFGPALEKPYSKAPASEPNVVSKTQAPVKPAPEQQLKPQTETKKSSDLPIARRASLHRFLEKRKDRTVSREPFQMNQQLEGILKGSGSSSTNEPEPEPVRELEVEAEEGGFPKHLDLNL
ncbi:protein TIFY 10B-like [Cucurbita moschata]|uniref:Protein TIFY n=1 Tax=Cucurbita moschata TaxID=3662 RepID=A0A6J1GSV3_CUCMO|nr:protein TIFY 10B-like [Cucurbita moschata]